MLITLSGMVGAGKSTTARTIVETLQRAGVDATYVRFRSLRMLPFRTQQRPSPPQNTSPAPSVRPRWSGFRARPLTLDKTCGYIARIVAFRLFGPGRSSGSCHVLDRYFYDSFVHYELRSRRERFYASVLQHLIPKPDVAIVVTASPETIAARRPEYAASYITATHYEYERLPERFPGLVRLDTEAGGRDVDRIDTLLRERLAKSGLRAQWPAERGVV
jgi:thymidylate kinase